MGIESAIAVVGCLLFVLVTGRVAAGGTVQVVSGMFRAPDLGWPSGVQEDDDLQWTWADASPGTVPAPAVDTGPVLQELEPSTPAISLEPLRRHRAPR